MQEAEAAKEERMDRRSFGVNRTLCLLAGGFLFVGFLLCVFLPKAEYSDSERRRLAVLPRLSVEAIIGGQFMEDFESFTVDTFPFREQLRKCKAWTAFHLFRRQDNEGLYDADGSLAAMEYPLREDSLEQAASQFAAVCEAYLTQENHIYLSVIPDKNCFLARDSGHPSMDYEEFEQLIRQKTGFAEYIRISDLLDKDDYYRTDPHWRQEKLADVAKRLLQRMNAQPSASQEYEVRTVRSDFYGAYYGQAALPAQPDTLRYLTGEDISACTAYDWQNRKVIPIYDRQKAQGKDPYEMFLSGPLSLVTVYHPNARTGRRLVLFRDSFGSALAPLLVEGYEQITLVDIRYIRADVLGELVDFEGCDVLFLYSTLVLNHSEEFKKY